VNRWIDHYNRPTSPEEQQLYDHWLQLSQQESPSQLVARFHELFVEGRDYPDSEIQAAVERIVCSEQAEFEFPFILNRCCYILINRWLLHPRSQGAIPNLVTVFQQQPSSPAYPRSVVRLRELVRLFTQTDQYLTLRRLADMLQQDPETVSRSQPLGSYIRRYPYLYEHCLLGETSTNEQCRTVRQIKAQAQRQFEIDLSQYITHRLVRSQPAKPPTVPLIQTPSSVVETNVRSTLEYIDCRLDPTNYVKLPNGQSLIVPALADHPQKIKNPTLLSDPVLNSAIKQFVCKVDGQHTQRDLAQQFLTYSRHTPSFRSFKHDLYGYLTAAIAPEYGKRQFYDRLYTQLCETLPESDDQPPTEFLLMRTCSKLLNFLVVDNPQQPNHFVFLDLINNVGTLLSVNLLLKIVLLCQKVKSHLEKRFSILFNHYEACSQESGIGWLVEALETLNVAFATNFGSIKFASFT
jgi:hypothetical protein